MRAFAGGWLASLCAAGLAFGGSGRQERVPAVVLQSTPYSRLEASARVVIRSPTEWARYQELLGGAPDGA